MPRVSGRTRLPSPPARWRAGGGQEPSKIRPRYSALDVILAPMEEQRDGGTVW
jgi:hypothetical protein